MASDQAPESSLVTARIEKWVQAGLISEEVAAALKAHEQRTASASAARLQLSTTMIGRAMIAGGIAVALGLISLIAANWESIPDAVKLITYFLSFGALAASAAKSLARGPGDLAGGAARETMLVVHSIMGLAGVGLIAQIFHTTGPVWQLLLFWSLLSFGAVILSTWSRLHEAWVWLVFVGLGLFLAEQQALAKWFSANPLLIPALPMLLGLTLSLLIKARLGSSGFTIGLAQISAVGFLGSVVLFEVTLRSLKLLRENKLGSELLNLQGALVLLIALLVSVPVLLRPNWSTPQRRLHGALLSVWCATAIMVGPVLSILPIALPEFLLLLASLLLTIALLALAALTSMSHERHRLVSIFAGLIGLRILVFWLDATGGLALSGFTLLTTGLLILGLSWVWLKKRDAIFAITRKWVGL